MIQQLQFKANVEDISKTISEVATNIESRTTFDDVQKLISDWLSRTSFDENNKSNVNLHSIKQDIQHVYNELKAEIDQIEGTWFNSDMPVSDAGIKELLSQKANKDSVA